MQPRNIEELAAANSFIRPGTSGLDEYVAGKKNPERVRKFDPRIDKHLEKTYSAIVFQEQIMFLISELMGISFGEADLYRRALEKPKKDKKGYVKNFQENVVEIAVKRGFDANVAATVRDLIIDNSGYAFNKSHAVAYSIISYWTAWIKANYPLVFYVTMFNGNLDNIPVFMEEARKNGVTFKPPCVSSSKYSSTIEDKENKIIRIGLNAVKGIGPAAVDSIVSNQPFANVKDFFERNNLRSVNKKVIEAAIKSGAMNNLPLEIEPSDIPDDYKAGFKFNNPNEVLLTKNQLFKWYELYNDVISTKSIPNYAVPVDMIKNRYMQTYELATENDQTIIVPEDKLSLFDLNIDQVSGFRTRKRPKAFLKLVDETKKVDPFRKPFIFNSDTLSTIKESYLQNYLDQCEEFGFSFLQHPLENHMDKIMLYEDVPDGGLLVTAGIIVDIIERLTKNNKKYYWVLLKTPRDTVRMTFWDNQMKQHESVVKKFGLIAARGTKGFGGMNIDAIKKINL